MASSKMIYTKNGMLPLEDNPPTYDKETQYIMDNGFEVLEDKVIRKYKIVKYEGKENKEEQLEKRIQELEHTINVMLGGGE